jgi:hypothetical protein
MEELLKAFKRLSELKTDYNKDLVQILKKIKDLTHDTPIGDKLEQEFFPNFQIPDFSGQLAEIEQWEKLILSATVSDFMNNSDLEVQKTKNAVVSDGENTDTQSTPPNSGLLSQNF